MEGPLVSIIIPAFNAFDTLEESISSALAQKEVSTEIIVVDDGSTDGSALVARKFGSDLRLFKGPNEGVSAARNRGIAESSAPWIVFLDADDLLSPGTLSNRLAALQRAGADVIGCDWEDFAEFPPADSRIRRFEIGRLEADPQVAVATDFWAPPAALMYRRSLVECIGGFRIDLPVIQDARLIFDAAYHGARFAHSPHVGAKRRIVADSLSRRDPAAFSRDVLLNGEQIEAMWRSRGDLSRQESTAITSIYRTAAGGLFEAGDGGYFRAVRRQRSASLRLSPRERMKLMLAQSVGLQSASWLIRRLRAVRRSVGLNRP
jgi:glycosyltransferase involved in cell wall biosynthesis